ncbi:nuclear transport factor 2 family protein (plasmid) [Sulfitobacter sp. W027]|uniref:nuclear transport factor 2 family protein n=1 Tax=Sulfitobacter sp. W027 TaxID=2867025 RepID=UPI0021A829FD|nr:nuclear transport factor 2 family protein [Sulfitobacter sp. W027]UWR35563.1 nuclear transport factor 2 family protein [Sulfitobacter sp. W027]
MSTGISTDDLADRELIRDCLFRYARGIDRADEAALQSAYWPGAWDQHGATSGPVEEFYDRVRGAWARGARNVHHINNILIDLLGDGRADVESYFLALQRGEGVDGITRQAMLSGRYCDRFEKRGGAWRIAHRVVVYDWVEPQAVPEESEVDRFGLRQPIGGVFPDDPVYRIGT